MRFGKPATPVAKRSCYQCSNGNHAKCVGMGCGCCDESKSEPETEIARQKTPRAAHPASSIPSGETGVWNRKWSSKEEEKDAIANTILRMMESFADYVGIVVVPK